VFLRFFRSSFATQYILISLIGLFIWGRTFFYPPQMPLPEDPAPFYYILYQILKGYPHISAILGFLMVMGSAFLLNWLNTGQEIVAKNSSLTALFFVVLMSYQPFFLTIHPVNISVFIFLLILKELFESYNRTESLELIYAAGFFVSIGSFFYFPFILFYAFILMSFIVFRSTSWRDWMSSFIGLMTPYLFLVVYYFFFNKIDSKLYDYSRFFKGSLHIIINNNPVFLIYSSGLLFGLIISFFNNLSHLQEKTIEIRKKNILLFWFILFVIFSFPFAGKFQTFHLLFLVIVVATFIPSYLLQRKKTFVAELMCLLFFIAILMNNLIFG
jgi:hypothetical protein